MTDIVTSDDEIAQDNVSRPFVFFISSSFNPPLGSAKDTGQPVTTEGYLEASCASQHFVDEDHNFRC